MVAESDHNLTEYDSMYPVISIGSLVIPTAGLIYIVGAWTSLSLVERTAKQLRLNPESVYGASATALFSGLIGARLTFVALYWSAFQENLLGIIWPLNSGYNVWGGVLVGSAAGVIYGRAKRLSPAPTLDALAPGLVLGLIFISLADFLAGPGFGTLTRVPWSITQYSVRRHPVQIYEILVGIGSLILWWRVSKYRAFSGQLFLLTIGAYSAGRLFVDAYRQNAWTSTGGYHILQIVSLVTMVGSLFLLGRLADRAAKRQNHLGR
jgi:phosphatidylglycerol:prolipoprotein diacylglycerol transferase